MGGFVRKELLESALELPPHVPLAGSLLFLGSVSIHVWRTERHHVADTTESRSHHE
jgi:hypothetical protein